MISVIDSRFSLEFPCAYGEPEYVAGFRCSPEDFYVEEILGFELTGEGEHACFYLEKTSQNTHWVAAQLAQHYGINDYDVSYCGRKDRHAVTRQWFSLYDPHKNINADNFPQIEGVKLLEAMRHNKKLRPGDHRANGFAIRLDNVCARNGNKLNAQEQAAFQSRALHIMDQGVPNYFGVQRFGREGNNLQMAETWFVTGRKPPRKQKSIVLSAARSWLFNGVLAERVRSNNWQQVLPGDNCDDRQQPTGPLWGRGRLLTSDQALLIEQQVQADYSQWCERLEYQGLKQERRTLVLKPQKSRCWWEDEHCVVAFELPAGGFATAVLAELAQLELGL